MSTPNNKRAEELSTTTPSPLWSDERTVYKQKIWAEAEKRMSQTNLLQENAESMGLGHPLTDEFTVSHDGKNFYARRYELGILYTDGAEVVAIPVENHDDGISVNVEELWEFKDFLFVWDVEISGFGGTYKEYYETHIQGKIPRMTGSIFRNGLMKHNQEYIRDGGTFHAHKTYIMPRYYKNNISWDAEMTGFSGTLQEYWDTYLRSGKVLGLSQGAFLAGVVMHNSQLVGDGYTFQAEKIYAMSRISGDEYFINHSSNAKQRNTRFDQVDAWRERWASLQFSAEQSLNAIIDETKMMYQIHGPDPVQAWYKTDGSALPEWIKPIFKEYEPFVLEDIGQAIHGLQLGAKELTELLLDKGGYKAIQGLSPDRNEANRIMRTFVSHLSTDIGILQQAYWQRRRKTDAKVSQTAYSLFVGDLLARDALRGFATPETDYQHQHVFTYFQDRVNVRLTPYADFCFVGLPHATMLSPDGGPSTDYLAIPHEIGHFVYAHDNFKMREQVLGLLADKGITQVRPDWRFRWLEELFADVYGCLIAGPIQVLGFQELLSDNVQIHSQVYEGEHAIDELRPLIQSKVLDSIHYQNGDKNGIGEKVYPKSPNALNNHWRDVLGKNAYTKRYLLPGSGNYMTGRGILEALDPVIEAILESLSFMLPKEKTSSGFPFAWTSDSDDIEEIYNEFTSISFLENREGNYKSLFGRRSFHPRNMVPPEFIADLKTKEMKDFSLTELRRNFNFALSKWTTEGPEGDHDFD